MIDDLKEVVALKVVSTQRTTHLGHSNPRLKVFRVIISGISVAIELLLEEKSAKLAG